MTINPCSSEFPIEDNLNLLLSHFQIYVHAKSGHSSKNRYDTIVRQPVQTGFRLTIDNGNDGDAFCMRHLNDYLGKFVYSVGHGTTIQNAY